MVVRNIQALSLLWQWIGKELWIACCDSTTRYKNPAAILALKRHTVFALVCGGKLNAICVGVGDLILEDHFKGTLFRIRRLRGTRRLDLYRAGLVPPETHIGKCRGGVLPSRSSCHQSSQTSDGTIREFGP